ncbi:7-cyano-7-deazaguanine synthase QueC [Longibacter salinarum]|uniref:7-cyano-7-deazaguanine synthase n=1 Tax=Longibacter salinarum TaxID=1850348 RepID=A0A2A8CUX1_9BACT|nr:7-cyano-7-deazaguanine synthase QueC [Longibacter salinarum]PEN12559.1 7-cyano-7-deazaguanine synthase QueC [Longibacter salinarum]
MPHPDSTDRSALVLFSGGQDSTTCLFWALDRFASVHALGFHYGQKHAVETEQARKIAVKADVPFEIIDMEGTLSGSALTEHEKDMSAAHERNEDLPASFVPGRNALFLSTAASYAYNRGIHDLVGGMCQTDYSGYPDCRRVFIDSMQTSLSLAMDEDLRIHTPLMYLTKAETWKLAADLVTVAGCDVLETVRVMSHTDYNGDRSELHEWGYGQLDNPASKLRAKGYREAKEKGWV